MTKIISMFGLSDMYIARRGLSSSSGFVAGAELEIEAVRDYSHCFMGDNDISCETDGSLRNNGREFLLPPSKKDQLIELFKGVHGCIDLGDDPFSVRTSTHVHVNCLYSHDYEVKKLLYLYAIFEPLAFSFVGEERKNNIHCMPLWSTHMPTYYGSSIETLAGDGRWHKYTALNLLPLRELGTVEFRHLGGTDDPERFSAWLDFINTLWDAAHEKEGKFDVNDLTDLKWLREVQSKLITPKFLCNCSERPQFILEDNLLNVKLAFI